MIDHQHHLLSAWKSTWMSPGLLMYSQYRPQSLELQNLFDLAIFSPFPFWQWRVKVFSRIDNWTAEYFFHLLVPILPSNTPVIFTQYCACKSPAMRMMTMMMTQTMVTIITIMMMRLTMVTIMMTKPTSKTCEQSVRKWETTGKLGSHSSVHE